MNPSSRLYLVRHANSAWADATRADYDRPLNTRGHRDAPPMVRYLAAHLPTLEYVVCSPAYRTRETLRYLQASRAVAAASLHFEPRVYGADVETLLTVLRETPSSAGTVMVVGHNPGVTACANALAPEARLDNVPTLGVVELEPEAAAWSQLAYATCHYRGFYRPKAINA